MINMEVGTPESPESKDSKMWREIGEILEGKPSSRPKLDTSGQTHQPLDVLHLSHRDSSVSPVENPPPSDERQPMIAKSTGPDIRMPVDTDLPKLNIESLPKIENLTAVQRSRVEALFRHLYSIYTDSVYAREYYAKNPYCQELVSAERDGPANKRILATPVVDFLTHSLQFLVLNPSPQPPFWKRVIDRVRGTPPKINMTIAASVAVKKFQDNLGEEAESSKERWIFDALAERFLKAAAMEKGNTSTKGHQ